MADGIKLDVVSLGLSGGILWGAATFLVGLSAWLFGWGNELVDLGSSLYLGYGPSFFGSLVGLVWGFADAFIGAAVFAWLYNMILEKRSAQVPVEKATKVTKPKK